MKRKYISRRIVVEARSARPFPIDMLRYDSCVPANEEDAHRIERMLLRYANGSDWVIEQVALLRFAPIDADADADASTGALGQNSIARWRSKYGWVVVSDEPDDQ